MEMKPSWDDIGLCPRRSFLPAHYRKDGTCRCNVRTLTITINVVIDPNVFDDVLELDAVPALICAISAQCDDGAGIESYTLHEVLGT